MSTGFRGNRAGSYQQTTFPANRAVITNSEGRIDFSPVTSGEVGYLANARSNIQEQIDGIINDTQAGSTTTYSSNKIEDLISQSGGNVTYDVSTFATGWNQLTSPPNSIAWGSAVVYDNEIHTFSGTSHYKWDGTNWTSVSTLPYNLFGSAAVVYDNEIHIFGGNGNETSHYKWSGSGSTWTSVSTLPANFMKGVFALYKNNIHIITADWDDNAPRHYQYITTWYPISAGPYTYAYDISSDHYESDSRPIWMLEGVNGLPTSAEYDDILKIGAAIFDENGIMLLATEQPSSGSVLKLIVKEV